ncbi:hypothetical protein ABZX85_19090 [Streptomyces sp. NPDC004539]|uniref:hypothetical protein n=1 Tax=Streptomyces sp. NPDC004539 TaxID=3154280 RepID=UPI0033B24224
MAACYAALIVTEEMWEAALEYPNGFPGDNNAPDWIACELDQHPHGDHFATLRDLTKADDGAVWAVWPAPEHAEIHHLVHCPSTSPKKQDACWLPTGHRGGHTWERFE